MMETSGTCKECIHFDVCSLWNTTDLEADEAHKYCYGNFKPASAVVEATKIKEAKVAITDKMDMFIDGWLNISADTVDYDDSNYWGGKAEAMKVAKELVASVLTDLIGNIS
ncbi:MAG: hypothetical protein IKA41_08760 [Bacteroidaceae bacterium]|nr:hypothetical protein [Bacteroidaceae bacterium]